MIPNGGADWLPHRVRIYWQSEIIFRFISAATLCMHKMHEIACATVQPLNGIAPVLARLGAADAAALKPTHEAGRRGGDSIARGGVCTI